jgi:hypothetical protein
MTTDKILAAIDEEIARLNKVRALLFTVQIPVDEFNRDPPSRESRSRHLAKIICPSSRFYVQLPKQQTNVNRSMSALACWQQLTF